MIKKMIIGISLCSIFMVGYMATAHATSPHISKQTLIEEERFNANLQYQYYQMDTSYEAAVAKVKRDVYTYTLNPSKDVKLAVWTYRSPQGYEKKTLTAIGEDYEKHHPGWVVLGGVNAEGYYNDEPTNALIQDGEVIRKDVSAEAFKELIGFKADGSVVIKQCPVASDTPRLKIDTKSYDITTVNALPDENGIAIILPDMMQAIDATGYRVFEINYSMYRRSSQFPAGTLSGDTLGIFVKGIVNQELSEVSMITTPSNRKVYLITRNETVGSHLTNGKEIVCQFDYIDEFSDVECMTGYMYKYLENGQTIPISYVDTTDMGQRVVYNCEYYKTTSKERAGIGFKADGSIVLLTANTKTGGPTQFEVGEMFKTLGCINAYQFDGGGSVTFLKRDVNGNLQMLNTPGDGHPRSIMTGLFVVARDPGLNSKYAESTPTTITLHKKNNDFAKGMENISVKVNNQTYQLEEESLTIKGLQENKEYEIEVNYTYEGKPCQATMYATTKAYDPGIDINPTSNGFEVSVRKTDEYIETTRIVLNIEGQTYPIEGIEIGKSYYIEGLLKGESYEVGYRYEGTNKETGEKFEKEVEAKSYTTLGYEVPEIERFEVEETRGKVKISYRYSDVDGIVNKAYIQQGTNRIEVEETRGSKTIEGIDRTKDQKFQLILEYEYEGLGGVVRSEEIVLEKEAHEHTWKEADCTHAKTCTGCGETVGEPLGHTYKEADCTHAKTCTRCNETVGEPLGHTYKEADCTHAKTCTRCNETEGNPLGHTWKEATKKEPKTCTVCGATEGEPLKGCKKASAMTLIASILALTTTLMILRKKR